MLTNGDDSEQNEDRGDKETFCEPSSECALEINRQIGDGMQANRQAYLCVLYQFYGNDLGNVPSYTLFDKESRASNTQLETLGKAHDITTCSLYFLTFFKTFCKSSVASVSIV